MLILIAVLFVIFNTSAYTKAYNKVMLELDLNYCNEIPSFKYTIRSQAFLFLGGSTPDIVSQRQACFDDVKFSLKLYGVSDETAKIYLDALRQNKPELCPNTGAFECLDAIKEKYNEPSVCSYYPSTEFDKGFVFECHAYLIIFGKENMDYCEQFDGDTKNECYYSIAKEYNHLMAKKPNPLVVHQTADGVSYFVPKPVIPSVCNNVIDSALKTSCEYVFNEFNSLQIQTLNS